MSCPLIENLDRIFPPVRFFSIELADELPPEQVEKLTDGTTSSYISSALEDESERGNLDIHLL